MTTKKEHLQHIGEALNRFYVQHGDEDEWDAYDRSCYDKLIARINEEDGEIEDETNPPSSAL